MDQRIVKFIKRHHVMTFSTVKDNKPWSCQVFYSYFEDDNSLLFTSSPETRHISEALENSDVAISIVLESKVVARLQGAQIEGRFMAAEDDKYRKAFIKKYPFIALTLGTLWRVEIISAKYTDNTLGFGTKLYYPDSKE